MMLGNAFAVRRTAGLLAAACAVTVLLLATRATAVERAAESVNSGGCAATSASFRAHDSIGQGAIGPMGQGATLRIYDGFWLGLPGINVPVEGVVYAVLADDDSAILRWTVGSLAEVAGFNVYRAADESDEYARLNREPIAAQSPGSYEDATLWPGTTFWYEVRALHVNGDEEVIAGSPASVTTPGTLILRLYPPSPNPGAGPRTIQFDVPDHVGPVHLALYNIRGQRVRTLVDGPVDRGRRESVWDGTNDAGAAVAAGVYLVRLELDGRALTEKILIIR